MKIWIDFINTPQVSFFAPFIKKFQEDGHELLLTCRDSGNTVDLLKQHDFQYHIVGDGVQSGKFRKIMGFVQRLVMLYRFIRKYRPDVAASQSSFYQPIVARIRNIPCLYTNDNEHAEGNLFGFLFATQVVLPVALKDAAFTRKWPLKNKVSYYPSVKEAIYLSQQLELLVDTGPQKRTIYFRPEPWTAQYYGGPLNFFDETLLSLSQDYKVVVLPRDKQQKDHYKQARFAAISVAERPLSLHQIVASCLLFIGAGGSMTRELAVLGIPVVSIYQDKLLRVDEYLVDQGLLRVDPAISYAEIQEMIGLNRGQSPEPSALNDGQASYAMIHDMIGGLAH